MGQAENGTLVSSLAPLSVCHLGLLTCASYFFFFFFIVLPSGVTKSHCNDLGPVLGCQSTVFPFFSHNLFIFGCAGSLLRCGLWLLCMGLTLWLWCSGFSLHWLLAGTRVLPGVRASVVAARGPRKCSSRVLERRLRSCGIRAYLHGSMWDLTSPGIQPVSLALAGRCFTTEPSGKP